MVWSTLVEWSSFCYFYDTCKIRSIFLRREYGTHVYICKVECEYMWLDSLLHARRNLERMSNNVHTDYRAPLLPKQGEDGGESHMFHEGSKVTAVSNLSTTIIGAGIMSLFAAMKVLGLVSRIMMLILVAFLTEASIKMLVRFSNEAHAESYGDISRATYGQTGKNLLEIAVVLNNLGDVLSGTSLHGDHHSGILDRWFRVHWCNGRVFVIFMTLAGLARFSSVENMDSLKASSFLSLGLAILFVGFAAVIFILKFSKGSIAKLRWFPILTDLSSFWNLFTVVPTFITTYVCHYNVHTIRNELIDQSEFPLIVQISLLVCSVIYIATSCFALLLFGDSTLDNVLSNFHSNLGIRFGSILGNIVQISYEGHLVSRKSQPSFVRGVKCRYFSRPSRGRPSPSSSRAPIASTMSRQRSKTRRAFLGNTESQPAYCNGYIYWTVHDTDFILGIDVGREEFVAVQLPQLTPIAL